MKVMLMVLTLIFMMQIYKLIFVKDKVLEMYLIYVFIIIS
jgi:hypothetical protein